MTLKIADNLTLPIDAITSTFAIMAIRGAGKSHTASVMAEEMLKAGQPIVAYDPTGAWWGLKSSADGKRPGFPVVIFGGEHSDVPLEETAGETIATTIVEKRIPAILDCSLLRKASRIRFMTTFCETLYHRNREPMHLFLDEVQTIAPQQIRNMPEASRLLGAVEDIILQGRRRGLGLTAISPRPAVVNASVRSACQTLIAMRVGSGKLDRKAIEEWVEAHGDEETAKAMLASLASLPTGDAWVWNPPANIFKRVHFRSRETFDSSATPKIGGKVVTPQKMAQVDLNALGDAIRATVEKAKADDPRELRRQIAELQKQLKAAGSVKPAETKEVRVEVPVLPDHIATKLEKCTTGLTAILTEISSGLAHFRQQAGKVYQQSSAANQKPGFVNRTPVPVNKTPMPVNNSRSAPILSGHDGNGSSLSKAERQILTAFYWTRGEQISPEKIAFYSNYAASSGGFNNALGKLRSAGLLMGWLITRDGISQAEAIGVADKPTGRELREWLRSKLQRAENCLLDVLCNAYPNRLTNEQIAGESGYAESSGGFNNALGRLRTIGAAQGYAKDGGTKASDVFFEE